MTIEKLAKELEDFLNEEINNQAIPADAYTAGYIAALKHVKDEFHSKIGFNPYKKFVYKAKQNGQYSGAGSYPAYYSAKGGKIWNRIGDMKSHIKLLSESSKKDVFIEEYELVLVNTIPIEDFK